MYSKQTCFIMKLHISGLQVHTLYLIEKLVPFKLSFNFFPVFGISRIIFYETRNNLDYIVTYYLKLWYNL